MIRIQFLLFRRRGAGNEIFLSCVIFVRLSLLGSGQSDCSQVVHGLLHNLLWDYSLVT